MEDIKFKSCSNPECKCDNPQPIINFSKNKNSVDGYHTRCLTCKNKGLKKFKENKKIFENLDKIDRQTTISCLYISGKSLKILSSIFKLSQEQIIEILKAEELFEFAICTSCEKLKSYSEYHKTSTAKTVSSQCKVCTLKRSLKDRNRGVPYTENFAVRLNKFEQIRNSDDILEAKCNYCGEWFIPTRSEIDRRLSAIRGISCVAENRLYCSDNCKSVCPIYRKVATVIMKEDTIRAGLFNPQELNREVQPELRQMVFARDNYTCVKCNTHKNQLCKGLHCHHTEGVRWNPLESADIDQCVTVCETCHVEIHKKPDCGYHDMRCDKT